MAIRSIADEAIPKLMSDERTSIVSSAKMHMRILRSVSRPAPIQMITLVQPNNIETATYIPP
jgi:hypothetical protein